MIETKTSYGSVVKSDYDSDGNLTYTLISFNGTVFTEHKAIYKGGKLEELDFDNENLTGKRTYNYLPALNQVKAVWFSPNNEILSSAIAKKDSLGNVVNVKYSDPSGNNYANVSFVYEYDNYGNWIRQFTYKNNQPYLLTERKIQYF